MKRNKKKITTIVDELITFFYAVGSANMNIQLSETEEVYQIAIFSDFAPEHLSRVQRLEKYLHHGRAPEIEESYWGLTGMGDMLDENELMLVGAMVDAADIQITNDAVSLKLFRKKNEN